MELVLTEKRGGGYHAHRPTCKKIGDKEQFDAEEFQSEVLQSQVVPCSSCKPKEEDMNTMIASGIKPTDPLHIGESVSEGEDDEFWDDDLLGDEDVSTLSAADRQVVAPETLTDEEQEELARVEAEQAERDEDLLGDDEPVAPADPPKVPAERKPPKAAPASTPAKSKDGELKAEQALELLTKVADHLGILLPEGLVFPGFGKAVKTEAKQTIYLNSKGTSDVRANSPEQASQWVEEGLAERRGGNYVRVAVRDL